MADDDEHTPVDNPRARHSSVTLSTAGLVLEALASRLSLPPLSPSRMDQETKDDATGIILDYFRRALERETRKLTAHVERLKADLASKDAELVAAHRDLAAAIARDPFRRGE